MKDRPFFTEAKLMLEAMPFVGKEKCFALKGGTAINFFIRDMPRLSVDIDLTYLPIEEREPSLKNISQALARIAKEINSSGSDFKATPVVEAKSKLLIKLLVKNKKIQIKIEPNMILRGSVFTTRDLDLSQKVEETFEVSGSMTVVSDADLYGGKICAALDRQHPREVGSR